MEVELGSRRVEFPIRGDVMHLRPVGAQRHKPQQKLDDTGDRYHSVTQTTVWVDERGRPVAFSVVV
jgi:hypothetical protein